MIDNLLIRYANKNDDIKKMAQLIYETDPYIYPALLGEKESGIDILSSIIKRNDAVFCYENILVAVMENEIVGVLVCLNKYYTWHMNFDFDLKPPYWDYTSENYMSKLHEYMSDDTLYISNISVDQKSHNKGIGSALIDYVLSHNKSKQLALHVLTDNKNAIHLYERKGFKIIQEDQGFSVNEDEVVKCYYMRTDID